jgi:hypothetical protein
LVLSYEQLRAAYDAWALFLVSGVAPVVAPDTAPEYHNTRPGPGVSVFRSQHYYYLYDDYG